MSLTYVYPAIKELQANVDERVAHALGEATAAGNEQQASILLAEVQTGIQRHVVTTWWALADKLVVRYNDMNFNFPEWAPTTTGSVGYPAWWLEMIGFNNDNWKQTWVQFDADPPALLEKNLALAATEEAPQPLRD